MCFNINQLTYKRFIVASLKFGWKDVDSSLLAMNYSNTDAVIYVVEQSKNIKRRTFMHALVERTWNLKGCLSVTGVNKATEMMPLKIRPCKSLKIQRPKTAEQKFRKKFLVSIKTHNWLKKISLS